MALTEKNISLIEDVLKTSLRNKFKTYNPETKYMPFHTRLLGADRMALFSFIHSLNTTFGTSIFEPVAKTIALHNDRFKCVKSHVSVGDKISQGSQNVIQDIIDNLVSAKLTPNKKDECDLIKKVCRKGEIKDVKPTKVDLWIESKNDELFLFDLKTVKPNRGSFIGFKRTLLEWVGCLLEENPETKVNTCIAIPYNPYYPKPYNRWTMVGMLDLNKELKVAEEFWDFLGGEGTYDELLNVFERVGLELREEIDDYFKKYNNK